MRLALNIWLVATMVCCNVALCDITPGPEPRIAGNLGLVIVASDTPEYIKEWLVTPSQHAVTIKRLRAAKTNQLIITSFLVTGMSPNFKGDYKFSVDFYLLDPNEKAVFGQRGYAKGEGKHQLKPTFVMANPALDIVLESSDPTGIYTIVAQVTDIVTGKKANASYKINYINDTL